MERCSPGHGGQDDPAQWKDDSSQPGSWPAGGKVLQTSDGVMVFAVTE